MYTDVEIINNPTQVRVRLNSSIRPKRYITPIIQNLNTPILSQKSMVRKKITEHLNDILDNNYKA